MKGRASFEGKKGPLTRTYCTLWINGWILDTAYAWIIIILQANKIHVSMTERKMLAC